MRAAATTLVVLLATFPCARAASISYNVTHVSGGTWQYDYTVANDGAIAGNIRLFDILFDPAIYDEPTLTIASDPALAGGWSQLILASGIGVPAAYDVLATGAGVATGASVSGFAIRFHWLGAGTPPAQPFEIYDPNTFALLDTGTTTAVPAPAGAWLLLTSLAAVLPRARRRA